MEEQKTIKDYIVNYLLDGEDEKRLDPVLVEWLAEDESHSCLLYTSDAADEL